MAYQPKTKESAFEENPNGVAMVQRLKDKSLGIKFSESTGNDFAGKKYRVREWPDYVKPKKVSGRTWRIRLTNDGNGIYSIAPQSGMFTGRVQKIVSKEGEPPVPKFKDYTYQGKLIEYYQFTTLIEIVDGDDACIGMVIPYTLRYNFGEDEDGSVMYTHGGSNAVHTPRLRDFLGLVGAWDKGEMKFSDNLLPKIQKRMLKAAKTFKFVVKDGWIDTIYADHSDEVEEAPWDDEEDWDNQNPSDTSPKPVESESDEFDW